MPRSDDFSQATKRQIAQRAGYVCGFPNCLAMTVGPSDTERGTVNIGEAAHICAASPNGPRYDPGMTSEERQSEENGIWMCSTHAALIDRDVVQYTVDVLRDWKSQAESNAMKMLGVPRGSSQGRLASVSQAIRLGADTAVLVGGQPIRHVPVINRDEAEEKITWYVSAFVAQFSLQKKQNLTHAVLEYLIVTVHETKPIPEYQILYGVYPAEVSMFYVDISPNGGKIPREFRPDRFYVHSEDAPETWSIAKPLVLDDAMPAYVALRINATESGMYLVSVDAMIASGEDRERLSVMPPEWVIFERYEFEDPDS